MAEQVTFREKQCWWQDVVRDGTILVVTSCRFLHLMSPAEVYRAYSGQFAGVEDIYHIERNVIGRRRRNRQLLELVQRDVRHS